MGFCRVTTVLPLPLPLQGFEGFLTKGGTLGIPIVEAKPTTRLYPPLPLINELELQLLKPSNGFKL